MTFYEAKSHNISKMNICISSDSSVSLFILVNKLEICSFILSIYFTLGPPKCSRLFICTYSETLKLYSYKTQFVTWKDIKSINRCILYTVARRHAWSALTLSDHSLIKGINLYKAPCVQCINMKMKLTIYGL